MRQKTRVGLGYSVFCRSMGLSSGKTPSTKSNPHFEEAVSRARVNIDCTVRILGWNFTNGIGYFRLSDSLIPHLYRSDAEQLRYRLQPDLHEIRRLIEETNTRLTFHFTTLSFAAIGTKWENHAARLLRFATIADQLGDNVWLECHLGQRPLTVNWLAQLVKNVQTLPLWAQRKLTFENDATWSPSDTLAACQAVRIPFTYDIEHHRLFARTRVSEPPTRFVREDIEGFIAKVRATWEARDTWATVHVSTPVDPNANEDRHADYVAFTDYSRLRRAISHVGGCYYVVIEAKQLDLAVLQLQRYTTGKRPYWSVKDTGGNYV